MKTEQLKAAKVIQNQHMTIQEAIALLQADLDAMTSTIHPDTPNWGDVSRFAHVADMAGGIIEQYEERKETE